MWMVLCSIHLRLLLLILHPSAFMFRRIWLVRLTTLVAQCIKQQLEPTLLLTSRVRRGAHRHSELATHPLGGKYDP